MPKLKYYLRKYPNRIKYGLLIIDIFAMIIAIRVYVNYVAIETTISSTTLEREGKMAELAFSQNFLVNYEKSDYAKFFLQHENNMLAPDEFIIKFEENTKPILTWSTETDTSTSQSQTPQDPNLITSPQASWAKFLQDKIK